MLQGQIGYVPADLTYLFDHFCSCGFSDWIWRPRDVPNALFGCSVTCNPTHRAAYMQVRCFLCHCSASLWWFDIHPVLAQGAAMPLCTPALDLVTLIGGPDHISIV